MIQKSNENYQKLTIMLPHLNNRYSADISTDQHCLLNYQKANKFNRLQMKR